MLKGSRIGAAAKAGHALDLETELNGAIVSSRAVVTRDVPPYAVVGGNPAKLIRQRFSPETIDVLQAIAWWDWPVDKITRHLAVIVSGDVQALRACAR